MGNLDSAADIVANVGEGESQKTGITFDDLPAAVLRRDEPDDFCRRGQDVSAATASLLRRRIGGTFPSLSTTKSTLDVPGPLGLITSPSTFGQSRKIVKGHNRWVEGDS